MTKEEMFNKNIKLAYKVANKYKINHYEEFEDIKQIALLGLWKAVTNYNGKNALSTFAYVVIQNEINSYLRKTKKSFKSVSINVEVHERLTLEDILQADDSIEELLDDIEERVIKQVLNETLENENERDNQVYKLYEQGYRQGQIAKIMGISQAQVSRIQAKINKKVCDKIAKN